MKTIGWNKELDLLKSGKLPQNIEAKNSPDDAPRKPKFSLLGRQSSVVIDVARDNASHENRQSKAKERETGEQVFGQNVDVEIPHNQNCVTFWNLPEVGEIVVFILLLALFAIGFSVALSTG